jgi:hypothetical protein
MARTRELFNLKTPNKTAAAAKAKEIYTTLVGMGWDAALEKFKPEMQRKAVSMVGDFLNELREHWSGKPKTFEDYCRSFRTILSQIFGIKGGREKFDYVNGGRAAWVAKIDRIKLAHVTPDKGEQVANRFRKKGRWKSSAAIGKFFRQLFVGCFRGLFKPSSIWAGEAGSTSKAFPFKRASRACEASIGSVFKRTSSSFSRPACLKPHRHFMY